METADKGHEASTKSKEEVLAERKAKKAEKAAKKSQGEKSVAPPPAVTVTESIPNTTAAPASKEGSLYWETTIFLLIHSWITSSGSTVKNEDTGKSKAELKAERRQKQEAQRAAKAAAAQEAKQPAVPKPQAPKRIPDQIQADRPSVEKRLVKRYVSQKVKHVLE